MIWLGLNREQKNDAVREFVSGRDVPKAFVIDGARYPSIQIPAESVTRVPWKEVGMYKWFYRLLHEIDSRSIVVIDECLRIQNRYDLKYNCIRHYLKQTPHVLIFQRFPSIQSHSDIATLVDFDTDSRWKRSGYSREFLARATINSSPLSLTFTERCVHVDDAVKDRYVKKKRQLVDGIGLRDPHTIPRNLYLMAGPCKLSAARGDERHVGRNRRLKVPRLETYRDITCGGNPAVVFEFPHNHIDFIDAAVATEQVEWPVLVTDLKVDQWYLDRFVKWEQENQRVYSDLC